MELIYDPQSENKIRLDSYISEMLPDISRSRAQELIKTGLVTVNGIKIKPSYRPDAGDVINVTVPAAGTVSIEAENIPLDIAYEDDDVIVINKPKGMVVHPANGHTEGTLVNALMYHCGNSLSGINGEKRPGIVHRIDKDTTGLIIACKNDAAHNSISAQLKEHSIERVYLALCYGNFIQEEGIVSAPIERNRLNRLEMAVARPGCGREAVTTYKVIERFSAKKAGKAPMTFISCRLKTGRTHQIRVHMKSIGHPLAGDELYGIRNDRFSGHGQYLHASVLGFTHPVTGERLRFEAPLPEYFALTLDRLRI